MIIKKKIKGLIESPNISFRTEPHEPIEVYQERKRDGILLGHIKFNGDPVFESASLPLGI